MLVLCIIALAITTLFPFIQAQPGKPTVLCHALSPDNNTCSQCIQLDSSCAWCADAGFDENNQRSRCDAHERLASAGCKDIHSPPSIVHTLLDRQLSETGEEEDSENIVQLRPQRMKLTMRPRQPITFQVQYSQALDYPVDLYFLMDLSNSMLDDKHKLSELGDMLAARMRGITKAFRLGFGSFVDKKVVPIVDPKPKYQNEPCAGCVEPYAFKHHMALTKDTRLFKQEVNNSAISGNFDAPESGLEALVQALACKDAVGWRNNSRKMIVLSTDAGFHFAGDGRLAGLVVPNDGECHLDTGGRYYIDGQDYPSISQIHKKIKENKANVIFAVTKSQTELYEHLKETLSDVGTSVGELSDDSSNIVDLIEKEYNKITAKIIMGDNVHMLQSMKIKYETQCRGSVWHTTNICDEIRVGDMITFNITLEVTQCTNKRKFTVVLGPAGIRDTLTIDVDVLCDCDCSRQKLPKHGNCSGQGDLVCGVCECAPPAVGRKCECTTGVPMSQLDTLCRPQDDPNLALGLHVAPCSGRGYCECGVCNCFPRPAPDVIKGRFCECDNFDCPRYNHSVCNNHGTCECKQCVCETGWSGTACECATTAHSCLAKNGKICGGRGTCKCGICQCEPDSDGTTYSPPTCELCPTCQGKCALYKSCVMCQRFGTGPLNATACASCEFTAQPVDEWPELNETMTTCQFVDATDGCTFFFAWIKDDYLGNVTVWAKRQKECPAPVPVLAIVLGVVLGIVLVGIILLCCWKAFAIIADRREYARFEQERNNAKWDTGENPIYNPATSTFKNPAYSGKHF